MRWISGIFCWGVVLTASAIGQDSKPPLSEVRNEVESARLEAEDKLWQELDAPRRGIKDRIAKVLAKTPVLDDQQVVSAVYLLTTGRSPTEDELKLAFKDFAATSGGLVRALQLTRRLVQGKEFSPEVAFANGRTLKTQKDVAIEPGTERGIGANFRGLTQEDLQKLIGDCAKSLSKPAKTDEQIADLAYLLTLSRFPTAAESNQVIAHLKKAPNLPKSTEDIFWFLLNTREFLMPQ